MNHTRMSRELFIDKVTRNMESHRALFEKALKGYRRRLIEELERRLEDVKKGRHIEQSIRLPEPQDHTDDYKRVILMAEYDLSDTVELSEREFSQYVMDQWDWTDAFSASTEAYLR